MNDNKDLIKEQKQTLNTLHIVSSSMYLHTNAIDTKNVFFFYSWQFYSKET